MLPRASAHPGPQELAASGLCSSLAPPSRPPRSPRAPPTPPAPGLAPRACPGALGSWPHWPLKLCPLLWSPGLPLLTFQRAPQGLGILTSRRVLLLQAPVLIQDPVVTQQQTGHMEAHWLSDASRPRGAPGAGTFRRWLRASGEATGDQGISY